jgi:hypothetical protein
MLVTSTARNYSVLGAGKRHRNPARRLHRKPLTMRKIEDEGNFALANEDVRSRYAESADPLAVLAVDDVFDPVACALAACFGDDGCALERGFCRLR